MSIVLEILYAIAAVATIGSFLHDLWTDYKEHGRSREGSGRESEVRQKTGGSSPRYPQYLRRPSWMV